ncbi:hypothetical protein V9T40_007039 [Parthenolecanium corni]|uniref:DNA-directed DNA polymerase n=1 Tax=Parthenolecanium corni TaxID=536013 RepID=A0AAN9YAE4_9HEMI
MDFKTAVDLRKHLEDILTKFRPTPPEDTIQKRSVLTAIDVLVENCFGKSKFEKNYTHQFPKKQSDSKLKKVDISPLEKIQEEFVSRKPTCPAPLDKRQVLGKNILNELPKLQSPISLGTILADLDLSDSESDEGVVPKRSFSGPNVNNKNKRVPTSLRTLFPFKKEIFVKSKTRKIKNKRVNIVPKLGSIFPFKNSLFEQNLPKATNKQYTSFVDDLSCFVDDFLNDPESVVSIFDPEVEVEMVAPEDPLYQEAMVLLNEYVNIPATPTPNMPVVEPQAPLRELNVRNKRETHTAKRNIFEGESDPLMNELEEFLHFNDPKPKIINKIFGPLAKKEKRNVTLNNIFPFHDDIFSNEKLGQGLDKVFPFKNDLFTKPKPKRDTLKYINIREVASRYIQKYTTHRKEYKITFKKDLPKDLKSDDLVGKALKEMVKFAKKQTDFKESDKMNIEVDNPKFNYPISTGYEGKDLVKKLQDKIIQILTSDESVNLTECTFNIHVVNLPRGAKPTKILNLATDVRTKRCIVQIKNNDFLCCPRAIVTALTYHTNVILERELSENEIVSVRKGRKMQEELAHELCSYLGEYPVEGFSLEEIRACEEILDVQIKVVCAENFNSLIYKGQKERDLKIYLYKQGNHFNVITKMSSFLGGVYYCHKCDVSYNTKSHHTCKPKDNACVLCMKPAHSEAERDSKFCTICNRYCFNTECLRAHINTVCPFVLKCTKCCKIMRRAGSSAHKCGWGKCRNCLEFVELAVHKCYLQRKKSKGGRCGKCGKCTPGMPMPKNKMEDKCTFTEKYLFFDYEAMQETGTHIPNLVIAQDFAGEKHIFDTNEEFCKWLISKEHKGYTAIAHYAKGYDSQFILQYCLANTLKPYTIYNGSKLMLLTIPSIKLKIIDSHNFLQAPLSSFPKTFELTELKKGYFPHLFNTQENRDYVGPMPDKKYYNYNRMKRLDRAKFLEWYIKKIQENYVFDMRKELVEYCMSDVDILRKGCMKFRELFLANNNIDPFLYVTIPSVCMAIFRSEYLKEKTIAIYDPDYKDKYSKQSISWLNSYENPDIVHALNGGEVVILGNKVDGFDENTNTVYQYHGCFWHGCPKCYKDSTVNNVKKESMGDLYAKTYHRTKVLKHAGYNVEETWECEWTKSKAYKIYSKNVKIVTPLDPRDAFFGGRTEAFKLKVLADGKKKQMKFADVCSLYPDIMYNGLFPIGHPTKIISPKYYNENWFGLIKCVLQAPKNLYIPVLPAKVKMIKAKANKLVFPLCSTCVQECQRVCKHNDSEREIEGTWATIEVNKAIEKGYKITKIHEVWDFEASDQLWKGYIRDFIKIKLETSPHSYESNEAYARDIKEKMGIDLDLKNIGENPGKRALAKLCLNSLWGKFGQRNNMPATEFVTDACRFYEILLDDRLQDINVLYLTDEMLQVNYKYKDKYLENKYNTNIFIAVYTTAQARLKLYDQLSALDRAVLYCDTDSIMYIDDGTNTIKSGEMLGEWTDELNGDYIDKWLCTGPKSYFYHTSKGKTCTKVKGFTLHHANAEKINEEALDKLIEWEIAQVTVEDNQITRDRLTKQLVNKVQTKTLSFNFDKRIITSDFDTLPYGYVEEE